MATPVDIENLLKQIGPYIEKSAGYASDHFTRNKIDLELFEGIQVDMTPEFCAKLYKELITDMVNYRRLIGTNYGLWVAMIPQKTKTDNILVSVQLGITFPAEA